MYRTSMNNILLKLHLFKLTRRPHTNVVNNTAIQQYNNTTIQQYNNTTIQHYNNTTIQQYNNTTIQQYNKQWT
mgnify:CR=1 FL=1